MGAALAGALAYLIGSNTGTPTPNPKHTPVPGPALWPYVLCAAILAIGALLYGTAHGALPWQKYRALRGRAETAESTLKDVRADLEKVRAELEEAKRAAIAAPTEPEPLPFELELYTGKAPPEYGDWITRHYLKIKNPAGQPERRVYVTQVGITPEPRHLAPYAPRPAFDYPVPPRRGGNAGAGLIVRPGQEESWFLGNTATGTDGKMNLFEFNVTNGARLSWQLDPDEDLRFTYRIRCDGVIGEMEFRIRVYSEDGKTVKVVLG
jgi:hypothetical protein